MKPDVWTTRICLLGTVFLVFFESFLVSQSLFVNPWTDEIRTLLETEKDLSQLWRSQYTHRTYAILAKICRPFGEDLEETILAIRLPAVLLALGSIVACFFLGREIFGPVAGFCAAAYLTLHPEALVLAKEARGFSGVLFFLALTTYFLHRAVVAGKKLSIGGACLSAYLAYLMHPTAALTFPGYLLAIGLHFGKQIKSSSDWKTELQNSKGTLAAMTAAFVLAAILFFPYFESYWKHESLFIPAFLTDPNVSFDYIHPYTSFEGFLLHTSPCVLSRGHIGPGYWFAIVLILVGAVSIGDRPKVARHLLLFPVAGVYLFFLVAQLNYVPRRYLVSVIPFAVVLCGNGIVRIAKFLGSHFSGRKKRIVAGASVAVLLGGLALGMWRPLLAETLYPSKPGNTSYLPTFQLLTVPPFDQSTLLMAKSPGWRRAFRAMGIPKSRIHEIPYPGILSATSEFKDRGLDRGALAIIPAATEYESLKGDLLDMGFVHFDPGARDSYLLHPELLSDEKAGEFASSLLEPLETNRGLLSMSLHSASLLAATFGLQDYAEDFKSRGIARAETLAKLDYPSRGGESVRFFSAYHLSRSQPLAAAQVYLDAIKRKPRSEFYFRWLFERIPKSHWNEVVSQQGFNGSRYAEGFVDCMETYHPDNQRYRSFWTAQVAKYLESAGEIRAATDLYVYSVKNLAVWKSRRSSDISFQACQDLVRMVTAEVFRSAVRQEGLDVSDFVRHAVDLLKKKDRLSSSDEDERYFSDLMGYRAYWSARLGQYLQQATFDEAAIGLYSLAIENGDTRDGKALRSIVDWRLKREDPEKALDAVLDAAFEVRSIDPLVFVILFRDAPLPSLAEAFRQSEMDLVRLARKIIEAFDRAETFSDGDRAYNAYKIGLKFLEIRLWEPAEILLIYSIENGDTEGRAALAMRFVREQRARSGRMRR